MPRLTAGLLCRAQVLRTYALTGPAGLQALHSKVAILTRLPNHRVGAVESPAATQLRQSASGCTA